MVDDTTRGTVPVTDDPDDSSSPLHDLGGYIRHQREGAKLSLRKLSKLAGVSNPYLSQIERGLRKPSAEILQAIARALEISSETLYVKAGILEEREGDGDLEGAIHRDPNLTDEQRQTLVRMYRTFRQLNAVHREAEAAVAEATREAEVVAPAPAAPARNPLERVVDAIIPHRADEAARRAVADATAQASAAVEKLADAVHPGDAAAPSAVGTTPGTAPAASGTDDADDAADAPDPEQLAPAPDGVLTEAG